MEYREFKLVTSYKPTGDQPQAIEELVKGIKENKKYHYVLRILLQLRYINHILA